ncbi:MAG: valine--tRNA ligase [Thermodesulfovibrionia bacterium]|nr:valine--tRNA ligase [Thermodesulfovibrionia bacterium]
MIDKRYNPEDVEKKWYKEWLEKGYFKAESKSDKPSYCIVIPPPNVTGSLHMGHALDITLQDIMIRWKRMSGFNTLWLPGTDHAGIATQNVVEKDLVKHGTNRHALGREKFIEKVWEWKKLHGDRIISQLKSMGASCDWSRERFTLDAGLSKAVREVFIRLYEEGLIYRGEYLINWCPRCHTALSDLEVEHEDRQGKLYYIKYNLAGEEGHLVVATTRPETFLGDTAVAVNPDDARYMHLIGKKIRLPLINREIIVIADEFVDSSFGTGAVKVTPAHDPNDFDMGQRHGLQFINILNGDGTMSEAAGRYKGQDRFECRKNVLKDLEDAGHLEMVKDHDHAIGHCYRCRTVVEPFLSKQWFVKIKPLAEEAIKSVKEGSVKIIPSGWENSYFDWMENIKDWCISRQIWWGHRIPVWYCGACGEVIVSAETPTQCKCGSMELKQDEDVLDTWFSSALWPFSTLGWPDDTDDLKTFYPTDVLITGFDILFFWVARMIMMGEKFMGKEPFRHTYIHALIRDEEGKKMSKSKGNVVDPLELTGEFGTDAVRFTLAAYAAQGRDIKFSKKKVEGYRHFINKIWNVSRFISMNITDDTVILPVKELKNLSLPSRWILSRVSAVSEDVNKSLEEYRFNDSAGILYQFMWHELCDWYVEMIKPELYSDDTASKNSAVSVLVHTFEATLRLMHPLMPFLTEELWQDCTVKDKAESICISRYPTASDGIPDPEAERKMKVIMDVVTGIRNIRGELNLSPGLQLTAMIRTMEGAKAVIDENITYITKLAKADIETGDDIVSPEGAATSIRPSMEIYVPLKGLFDIDAELSRLSKEMSKVQETFAFIDKKLSNEGFVSKAPEAVVEENKAKHSELKDKIDSIKENIDKLKEWKKSDG